MSAAVPQLKLEQKRLSQPAGVPANPSQLLLEWVLNKREKFSGFPTREQVELVLKKTWNGFKKWKNSAGFTKKGQVEFVLRKRDEGVFKKGRS